jgi:hypothetical protein
VALEENLAITKLKDEEGETLLANCKAKNGRTFLLEKEEKMGINCAVGNSNLWESECEMEMLILRVMERNALGLNCQYIYYIYQTSET